MKFQSRDQKIREYNEQYPVKNTDALERIRSYFDARGWDLAAASEKAAKKAVRILDERAYETIRIVLMEKPFQAERPRVWRNHAYSPNAANNKAYFEKAFHSVVTALRLVASPAEIIVNAYLEMPAGVPPDEVILFEAQLLNPVDRPDFDNLSKAYADMLTGVVTVDDDIFYRAEINKYYSLLPRVEILVTYLVRNESDYVYKKLKHRKVIRDGVKAGTVILERIDLD